MGNDLSDSERDHLERIFKEFYEIFKSVINKNVIRKEDNTWKKPPFDLTDIKTNIME
jgi:hypothetical protein